MLLVVRMSQPPKFDRVAFLINGQRFQNSILIIIEHYGL